MPKEGVRVTCFETQEEFGTIRAASQRAGVCPTAIARAMRTREPAGGLHWYRTSDGAPELRELVPVREKKQVSVRCVETGEIFGSIADASRAKGVNKGLICIAVSGKAGAFHWEALRPEVETESRRD